MTSRTQEPRHVSPWKDRAHQQYEAFLGRLSVKGRAAEEKHVETCETEGAAGFGDLWRRLAGGLGKLAPFAIESAGAALKFHIPDGKYRQQVFALEDSRKGVISLYMPDVSTRAVQEKLLTPVADRRAFKVPGGSQIEFEVITAETPDMTACKPMLGWGKRAFRVNVDMTTDEKMLRAIEGLCELAAEAWANVPAPAEPEGKK